MDKLNSKAQIMNQITKDLIAEHKETGVPMVFKTADCAESEWIKFDLNTLELSKIKFESFGNNNKLTWLD